MPDLLSLGTDLAEDVAATIEHAIADNPPAQWRDGGFLRRGYHAELEMCIRDSTDEEQRRIFALAHGRCIV